MQTQCSPKTGGLGATENMQGLCGFQSERSRMKPSQVSALDLNFSSTVDQQSLTSQPSQTSASGSTHLGGHEAHSACCVCNSYSRMDGLSQLFCLCVASFNSAFFFLNSAKWIQQQNHRFMGQIKALTQTSMCPVASAGYQPL